MSPSAIARALREHELEDEHRHEENVGRFTRLEVSVAGIQGGMRIVIALLAANVILNAFTAIHP